MAKRKIVKAAKKTAEKTVKTTRAGKKKAAAPVKRKTKKAEGRPASLSAATAAAAATAVPPPIVAADPFDLASLAIPQSFATSQVKKALHTLPVRKPHRQEFVRVHPTARGVVALITDKTDGAEYICSDPERTGFVQALSEALPGEVVPKMLYLTVSRQGVAFLWPIRLPAADGKDNDWHRSAREAAAEAVHTWVRIASNRALGAYEVFTAAGISTEPAFPENADDWGALLQIAFRSRLITSFDHPLIRQLTGE